MNKRIKKLAEQAGITTNRDTADYHKKYMDKWIGCFAEKLAELIVRECAEVAGKDVRHFVLEHFGLQESGK